jgi:hypothetical protein
MKLVVNSADNHVLSYATGTVDPVVPGGATSITVPDSDTVPMWNALAAIPVGRVGGATYSAGVYATWSTPGPTFTDLRVAIDKIKAATTLEELRAALVALEESRL